jgi:hypothetical protein
MSQATQKEYCPSCSQRSIGLQPGHICWRCRLSAMILPDIQTIHVVVGANGLYTHQHSQPENMETQIVFPDRTYTVIYLPNDKNSTHALIWGNHLVHASYQSPVSPINGVHQCLNWIVNTRNLEIIRAKEQT